MKAYPKIWLDGQVRFAVDTRERKVGRRKQTKINEALLRVGKDKTRWIKIDESDIINNGKP